MSKVYVEGYAEFWIGFSLTGDPEVMYSALGIVNTDWAPADFTQTVIDDFITIIQDTFQLWVPSAYTIGQSFALVGLGTTATLPFRIVGLMGGAINAGGQGEQGNGSDNTSAYNHVLVTFNQQDFRAGTGGV